MYSYPPHSDQEDVFTDFGGAHDYHEIPQDAYNEIPSDTGLIDGYVYDLQHHAPQMYDNLAGGVPSNLPVSCQLEAMSVIAYDDL